MLAEAFVPTMDQIGERVEDPGEAVFAGRQVQNDVFALRQPDAVSRFDLGRPGRPATTHLLMGVRRG